MGQEATIFSERLKYFMSRAGKDQIDLIHDLGINKSTISTWCNGKKLPRMASIQALADYFGILKSDLLEEKPPPSTDASQQKYEDLIRQIQQLDPHQAQRVQDFIAGLLS